VYSIENVTSFEKDNPITRGTVRSAPIMICDGIGTVFPNSIVEKNDVVYFVDSAGDISQIYGTEVKKSNIKIKEFRWLAYLYGRGEWDGAYKIKAFRFNDIISFTCLDWQNCFNWKLYCVIDRPTEGLSGTFIYERYENDKNKVIDFFNYGAVQYGNEMFGGGLYVNGIDGSHVGLCAGNIMYLVGFHDKYRSVKEFRVARMFEKNLYEDLFLGE
jgi:hypothetical protein